VRIYGFLLRELRAPLFTVDALMARITAYRADVVPIPGET